MKKSVTSALAAGALVFAVGMPLLGGGHIGAAAAGQTTAITGPPVTGTIVSHVKADLGHTKVAVRETSWEIANIARQPIEPPVR